MEKPQELITGLVEHFDRNIDAYRNAFYNETQVRREFIDPFFGALGWDVSNTAGYAEQYKDVIHEDAIKVGGATKAPDYCFRIGGVRKFFLEAKKPSINIKMDINPAYQLKRYAWSAKLPLSILTDFEEFAVYDCRTRPKATDKVGTARIFYCTYREYLDRLPEIINIFSKEAILQGSFDKYVKSTKGKRGTSEVDHEFLKEIEGWRELLAKNIALRNSELTIRELNFAVQRIMDRIIFLRMCEDRDIEQYGQLQSLINGANIYKRFQQICSRAEAKYNSSLFNFRADKLTPEIIIDDRVFKTIFSHLYYPECPYEFSVLGADILGNVYEQFLGKVIHLTPSHKARIEEKPEVKKAGGVYYTPTYIVDYIIKQTVGRLCKGKTPRQISKLRILDPACGSGSFLLGAYQYLIDHHLDWYQKDGLQKHTKEVYQSSKGQWNLTTKEKKRILLNNIYGVDIDHQAVEVTKLSLLLKVLEGENKETLQQQLTFWQERALPNLNNNIKCGNSLIGPDFYNQQSFTFLNEEEIYMINVFDWNDYERGFGEIMKAGGFDAVIGNPPWISLTGKFGAGIYPKSEIEYLIHKFTGNTYMPNMYEYFVAQGLNLLTVGGYFGYIVPDRLGFNSQFTELRKEILKQMQIILLVYKASFPGITADTVMFVLKRTSKPSLRSPVKIGEYGQELLLIPQIEFEQDSSYSFQYYSSTSAMNLIKKLEGSPAIAFLSSFCESTSGFGGKSKLIFPNRISPLQIETIKGDSIGRYTFKKSYWFDFRKENITGRTTDKAKLGAKPKILLRKTGDRILATFDDSGIFPEQSLYFMFNNRTNLDFKYLLGILNSALMTFYYRNRLITNIRSIAQLKKIHLDKMPIRTIDFNNKKEKALHDKIVSLVDMMLDLHKKLQNAKIDYGKEFLERQIKITDDQIDRLVYELYGLTEEEIKVVEGYEKNNYKP